MAANRFHAWERILRFLFPERTSGDRVSWEGLPVGPALACAIGAGAFSRPALNHLVGYPDGRSYFYFGHEFLPTLSLSVVLATTALYALVFTAARRLYRHHPAWKHWGFLLVVAYYATTAESFRTIVSGEPTVWAPFPGFGFSLIAVVGIPCLFLSIRSPMDGLFCAGMAALYAAHPQGMWNLRVDLFYFVTVPVAVIYLFLTAGRRVRVVACVIPLLIVIIPIWGMRVRLINPWRSAVLLPSSVYLGAPALGSGIYLVARLVRRLHNKAPYGTAEPSG